MDINSAKSILISVDQIQVDTCYFQEGEALKGDVVLMHTGGAGASAFMCWFLNFNALVKAGYRVTAPDAPGFGRTKIHGENTPDPVSFLRSFLKAMEISRCHLVGNSMGGMTVSKYAAEHPELVSSLTLSGGEPRIETSQVSTLGSLGATPRNDFVRKMFNKPQLLLEDLRTATADFFFDRDHEMVGTVTELRFNTLMDKNTYAFAKENSLGQIKRRGSDAPVSYLEKILSPTLLLHGRDEIWFYPATHREILMDAALKAGVTIPDCTTILLPHCAHWPQIEYPFLYNQLLIGFLDRNP
tara:strand:- start:4057 stop:4953 length:897 start_codon:yes stop_codon:yes gene_type:complete